MEISSFEYYKKQKSNAFVRHFPPNQSVIISDVVVFPVLSTDKNAKPLKATAIWDTGATHTAIASGLARQLGLAPIGKREVHGVHGKRVVDKYLVDFVLADTITAEKYEVTAADNLGKAGLLIGMDIIARGDFCISHSRTGIVFSFRFPGAPFPIDFVDDINRFNSTIERAKKTAGQEKAQIIARKKARHHGKRKR